MQYLRKKHSSLVTSGFIVFGALLVSVAITQVTAYDVPTSVSITVCGDAIVSSGETCDDGFGNNVGGYGSSTALRKCTADCLAFGPYCGDSILQVRYDEQCDDGNNTSGDLCSSSCTTETPVVPGIGGSPSVGSTAPIPGAPVGQLSATNQTTVVLRGKAYPNSIVNILLDGVVKGTVLADVNADFLYTTTDITPGIATFGFWARDTNGIESITTSVVFDVAQSAVSTVANVFFPPTISVSDRQVAKGDPLTIFGQSVPNAKVVTDIKGASEASLEADVDGSGSWALQVDTASLSDGLHTVKAYFSQGASVQSGFGKSISLNIGEGSFSDTGSPDLNGDTKVNLVDFSIFLLKWGTDDIQSDFNSDGTVNLGDFSIMLFNWTG